MEEGLPTFDLECLRWTTPIAIGFFDGTEYKEFVRETEDEDLVWKFLNHLRYYYQGIKIYAHCASKFDNKFILSSLLAHDQQVGLETGLVKLQWKDTGISFEDSYLVIPMPLEKANRIFGVEKKEEWDHEQTRYPWEMTSKLPTFLSYLKTDCLSLSHLMGKVCELLGTTFGTMPSISISTTAAKVFNKLFYPLEEVHPNEEFEDIIREAIYGGRNEVYKKYGEDINMYDVRGMFVSCYNVPVPVGRLRWVKPNLDKGTAAEAEVWVPEDWDVGPLPVKKNGRLIFPVGKLPLSWWDMIELRNAAELGCEIKIRRQLYSEEEPILESFGKFVGKLRGTKQDEFWKIFGLALSGKLGQGRWRDTTKHIDDIKDLKGWTPIDEKELYYNSKEYSGSRSPYIRPAIAMRVRAAARVKHLKHILEAKEKGDIFYCDTDSIYTTASLDTGEEVGQLSFLGKASRGYFIRQKLYGYVEKGKLVQKSSGYSDTKLQEKDFIGMLGGDIIQRGEVRLPSLKKLLKSGEIKLYEKGEQPKASLNIDNRVSEEGEETKPIKLT